MKKLICMLLVMVMVLSMMPVHAFAAETEHHDHTSDAEIAAKLDAKRIADAKVVLEKDAGVMDKL